MQFFDSTKSIVENMYMLSGPLIFLIALFGLWQLKIAQDAIKISSQREASKVTIQICDFHIPSLSKSYNNLVEAMEGLGIDNKELERLDLLSLKDIKKDIENNVVFKNALIDNDS